MLRHWLDTLFAPFLYDEREKARIARFLRGTLTFGIVTTVISTAGLLVFVAWQPIVIALNGSLLFLEVVMWFLVQKGQLRQASIFMLFAFVVYISIGLYISDGISNSLLSMYIVLVLVGGTLLGQFGVLFVSILAGFSTLIILYLQIHGLLLQTSVSNPVGNWITFISIMLGGTVVMYLWFGTVRDSINAARHELAERQRAESALRASESRLSLLLNALPDLALVIDATGTYRDIFTGNPNLLNGGFENFIGKKMQDVMPPQTAEKTWAVVERALQTGEVQAYHYEMVTKIGRRWFHARVAPYENDGEKLVLWVARDNTIQQKIENELRASEERYRLISSVISDYSFASRINPDGSPRQEWVAGAFEAISGYAFDEFIATGGWPAHLHPDDILKDQQDMELLRQNQRTTSEMRIIHKDGSTRWVRIYAHPVWDDAQNCLVGIYGAVQNITIQKIAEEREVRQRKMLERVLAFGKNVTAIKDLDGCLRAIHQSVQKGLEFDRVGIFLYDPATKNIKGTYGTDRNGNIEKTDWFEQSVEDFAEWKAVIENPHGFNLVDDYQQLHQRSADSEMCGVKQHLTLAAWVGEKPIGLIAVDNLISGRPILRENIEALQLFVGYAGLAIENARMNTNLEQRVAQRTAELEMVVNELEGFSYTISHDLRAPLRGIHGYLSIMLEEVGDDLPYQAKTYLNKVRRNAHTMGELVDDLLAFLRLNRKEIRKVSFSIEQTVMRVYSTLRAGELPQRKIEFICDPLPSCVGDPELIAQALTDLISNALKFTRAREHTIIHFGSMKQDGKTAYFIRDNGIGFDMRYYSKLFGVFQRLHAPDTQVAFEGTGVGLAIAQRVIQRHNGRIWAEAEVDRGATFFFTIG